MCGRHDGARLTLGRRGREKGGSDEPADHALGRSRGGFGENLTLRGSDERSLCVGDVLEVWAAQLQIASPRGPCADISRRWNAEWLLKRVVELRRTGWYLRVLREGAVTRGDEVRLLQRPHPGWTIDRLSALRTVTPRARAELGAAASLGALSPEWRELFGKLSSRD